MSDERYFCTKCGTMPETAIHEGCNYTAFPITESAKDKEITRLQDRCEDLKTLLDNANMSIGLAVQEQKEKDAEIVKAFPDACCDECNNLIAKAILEA